MFDKQFIEKQKQKLLKMKDEMITEIKKTGKFPDYGTSEDDNVLEVEDFQENLAQQKNSKEELIQVNAALIRIEKGIYGKCLECGKIIKKGRMEIFPQAAYCRVHAPKKK